MPHDSGLSRRSFLVRAGATGIGLTMAGRGNLFAGETATDQPPDDPSRMIAGIADPAIRTGMEAAILKNMIPAAVETDYPGYFWISADGQAYGNATWPGLDSWQMAGAYLLMGRTRMVLDYFDFVRASQRKDGHIPFAIFPGNTPAAGCLSGLNTPHDVYIYKPPKREGLPTSSRQPRSWIGLFKHWHPKDPLGVLAPVCFVLTAAEIFDATGAAAWLRERLPSLEAAAKYVLSRKDKNGLIGGAGFYLELPARYNWDGVTQCYAIHAFRELARLFRAAGDATSHATWSAHADKLTEVFDAAFWRDDHFGEYVHPERGLVDLHGLSDVNWAAVAFGIVDGRKLEALWPRLMKEKGFWWGDMPTQTVSKPLGYEKWEYNEPLPVQATPLNDVAAMGRVWYLEAVACRRMKAHRRLIESARKVCRAAKADGYWRERYHAQANGTVAPAGAEKYCEYAAILTRVVLGNRSLFFG
ncbi:MAG: hypothetical protein WCB27_21365 [Thermoguttaceae bacterium]